MCKVQMLRALVKQRLAAAAEDIFGLFERTIAEYEEELSRTREENERQRKLLDAVEGRDEGPSLDQEDPEPPHIKEEQLQDWSSGQDQEDPEPPHIKEEPQELWSSGLDQEDPEPPHIKEEQQELWSSGLDQEGPEPPHIKEEQQELWSSGLDQEDPEPPHIKEEQQEEGEQLQGLEEADITKFPLTAVPPDEEEAHSSQLHHMEADGEDRGGPGPAGTSDPRARPGPEPEPGPSWRSGEEEPACHRSFRGSETRKNLHLRTPCGEKLFGCSLCSRAFTRRENLQRHTRTHTGERPFRCSVCHKTFSHSGTLQKHTRTHSAEKDLRCSRCGQKFKWRTVLERHVLHQCGRNPLQWD